MSEVASHSPLQQALDVAPSSNESLLSGSWPTHGEVGHHDYGDVRYLIWVVPYRGGVGVAEFMEFTGLVASGLGRAHVFMAQDHYQNQFKPLLGSGAWPGTLNIELDDSAHDAWQAIRIASGLPAESTNITCDAEMFRIDGFEREGRSFGGATAMLATLYVGDGLSESVAVLLPDLTRHKDVMELISSRFLREALGLTDGDPVRVVVS